MECEVPVKQVHLKPGMTVENLIQTMEQAGAYNGGALTRAVKITGTMFESKNVTRFFGLAGAMVPAGMGGIISDLMDAGYIHALVSTGANLTHDVIEAIGCHHFRGTEKCNDVELRHDAINRIYDVYLPNESFIQFEEFMQDVLSKIPDGSVLSITELLEHIGLNLKTGILATAARNKIPVFCPAIQDSMIGLQFWLYRQTHKIIVDAFGDMNRIMDLCFDAEIAGAFLIGGGVPKNYILQSMLMTPKGFTYAVQLTGDRPDLGGLSGATLDEARSWGKVDEDAQTVTVYGDATITLPLIISAALERIS